jgi:hypothetical protein
VTSQESLTSLPLVNDLPLGGKSAPRFRSFNRFALPLPIEVIDVITHILFRVYIFVIITDHQVQCYLVWDDSHIVLTAHTYSLGPVG